MSSKLALLPLSSIRENPVALRPVQRDTEEYLGLVDSVRQVGVLNAISVRQVRDPETGESYYSLVDGLHRYNAAMDAGLREIPATIITADEANVLEIQIMANIHKVETKPVEYTQQLVRILAHNPMLTVPGLAAKLAKSAAWLSQRLKLVRLAEQVQDLVNEGTINISNAQALADLPAEEQMNYLDRAMSMTPGEFLPTVGARVKEIRDAKRQGKAPAEDGFTPVPHVRKVSELKAEAERPEVGVSLISQYGVTAPEDAWRLAIQWTLSVDPTSVEIAKAKYEARKAEAKAARERRAAEREAEKAAKIAEVVAAVA